MNYIETFRVIGALIFPSPSFLNKNRVKRAFERAKKNLAPPNPLPPTYLYSSRDHIYLHQGYSFTGCVVKLSARRELREKRARQKLVIIKM
jgi:hypothetical protein